MVTAKSAFVVPIDGEVFIVALAFVPLLIGFENDDKRGLEAAYEQDADCLS